MVDRFSGLITLLQIVRVIGVMVDGFREYSSYQCDGEWFSGLVTLLQNIRVVSVIMDGLRGLLLNSVAFDCQCDGGWFSGVMTPLQNILVTSVMVEGFRAISVIVDGLRGCLLYCVVLEFSERRSREPVYDVQASLWDGCGRSEPERACVGGASHRERVWAEQGAFESAAPQWEERLDERERIGWSVTPNALRGRFSPC
ncbi:unnamed protein product [Toxocara canis]|uniref:Secreted protein n=1 Tax=Toxocara canis TaxID=6265 RepID=A0A183VAS9_TOXCA|nr:unnamed protein product [Toxocara canis]